MYFTIYIFCKLDIRIMALHSCKDFMENFINALVEKIDIQCSLMKSGSYLV